MRSSHCCDKNKLCCPHSAHPPGTPWHEVPRAGCSLFFLIYGKFIDSSVKFKPPSGDSVHRKQHRHSVQIWIVQFPGIIRLPQQTDAQRFVPETDAVCTPGKMNGCSITATCNLLDFHRIPTLFMNYIYLIISFVISQVRNLCKSLP